MKQRSRVSTLYIVLFRHDSEVNKQIAVNVVAFITTVSDCSVL